MRGFRAAREILKQAPAALGIARRVGLVHRATPEVRIRSGSASVTLRFLCAWQR